jgi:hypothetical protein
MNKQNLSTRDRWLIKKWEKALLFEDAMATARQHYENLFSEVHQRVKSKYPDLQGYTPHRLMDKVASADYDDGSGCVVFFHPKWVRARGFWESGIWLSNISLDELATALGPAPNASIWLSVSKPDDKRIEKLRSRLRPRYSRIGHRRSLRFQEHDPTTSRTCLWYELPEERSRLLRMVLQNDGQPFVDCIANHVEVMAGLVQGLDDLLR